MREQLAYANGRADAAEKASASLRSEMASLRLELLETASANAVLRASIDHEARHARALAASEARDDEMRRLMRALDDEREARRMLEERLSDLPPPSHPAPHPAPQSQPPPLPTQQPAAAPAPPAAAAPAATPAPTQQQAAPTARDVQLRTMQPTGGISSGAASNGSGPAMTPSSFLAEMQACDAMEVNTNTSIAQVVGDSPTQADLMG